MRKIFSALLLLSVFSSFGADYYRVKTIDTLNCKMRFYNSASEKIYEIDLTGAVYSRGSANEYIIKDDLTQVSVKSGYLTTPRFTFLDTLLSTSQLHCYNYGGVPQSRLIDSIEAIKEQYLPLSGGEMNDGANISFINGSRIQRGTTDAGLGGNKGIALRCAVDYELKWEAGRLYVMQGDGSTIRQSLFNFSNTPTVNDDETKGYVSGSIYGIDNGTTYTCLDATEGSAVWVINPLPYLQINDTVTLNIDDPAVYDAETGWLTIPANKGKITLTGTENLGNLQINYINASTPNVPLRFTKKVNGTSFQFIQGNDILNKNYGNPVLWIDDVDYIKYEYFIGAELFEAVDFHSYD